MSITYAIDSAKRTVTLIARDTLNRSMVEDAFARIAADPAFDACYDTVADFSDVVYLDLDVVDIQSLAGLMLKSHMRRGRFAIITGEDQGRYSLGVYFKALTENMNETGQRIFRTAHEANAWLARDLPAFT